MKLVLVLSFSLYSVGNNRSIDLFTDSSNSKYSNRRNGKTISIQPQRTESIRNIGPKKNSNNCKQPQPRASLFCRKKGSEVSEINKFINIL